MTEKPETKAQQVLNRDSDWNQAANDEPVYVIRASNWKATMMIAVLARNDEAGKIVLESAMAMRKYHLENDEIPF